MRSSMRRQMLDGDRNGHLIRIRIAWTNAIVEMADARAIEHPAYRSANSLRA